MKRKIWVWTLGIVIVTAAVLGVIVWDLRRKAAAVLKRHEVSTAAKLEEFRARSWPRVILFGEALPGNRWDSYAKALDSLDAIPEADTNEIPEVRTDVEFTPDLEKLDAVFAAHQPSVDLLRDAFRRGALTPPYAYEQGFAMELPYVSHAIKSARYLTGAAGWHHGHGRDREAMDHVLMAIAAGHDTACGGPLVNHLVMIVCEEVAISKCRSILESHSLSPKDLEALAGTLDRMKDLRPRLSEAFEIEDASSRHGMARSSGNLAQAGILSSGQLVRTWRYLFSADLVMADALNEFERFYQDAAALDRVREGERVAAGTRLMEKAASSRNPMVALVLPSLGRTHEREAVAGMKWNLMRTAVALAWYEAERGAFPESLQCLAPRYLPKVLDCPFSGKPFRLEDGKLWSFGGDGDDDQGRPLADEDREREDGDVVWTLKRK